MLRKLIPAVIALVGLGAGVAAGIVLRPGADHDDTAAAAPLANPCGEVLPVLGATLTAAAPARASEFVEMSNQFVFPLVKDNDVVALVVLSLSLEVAEGQRDAVHLREPKLRDAFLRVLLDHANAGGFAGAFTSTDSMDRLRRALLEKGREDLGPALFDVLILDINRQDA